MGTRFTVFDSGVRSDEVLHWLGKPDQPVELACNSKECAPPPVGKGGSSGAGGVAQRALEAIRSQGGATLDTKRNMRPVTSGYVVAEQPKRSQSVHIDKIDAAHIESFLERNAAALARPGNKFGVWHDTQTGQVWLDVVKVYPSTPAGRTRAVAAGQRHNQIAIYHLDSGEEIGTGGTGIAAGLVFSLVSAVVDQAPTDTRMAIYRKYGREGTALVAACRSKACAPPPVGRGGSDPGAGSGISIYEVGGAVRDEIMGIPSNDVDFAVTAPSYEAMRQHLIDQGFKIFTEDPKFNTIRARPPEGHPLLERTTSADFVLARRDAPTGDGRRPDYTEPGTLADDLARRDFTVNAIAKDAKGDLIDPHNGQADIASRTLRFVGDPMQRVDEDGLRVLRGFRFMVTKDLTADPATWDALTSPKAAERLGSVSKERIANELTKMFDHDTQASIKLLSTLPDETLRAIFPAGVRLTPTMKKQKGAA